MGRLNCALLEIIVIFIPRAARGYKCADRETVASGPARTSCPELSRAESGEWRVEYDSLSPDCQLNVNLQTSSSSWAQEHRSQQNAGNISVFISLVVRGGYRYCPGRLPGVTPFQPAARCNCCNLSNIFFLSPSED